MPSNYLKQTYHIQSAGPFCFFGCVPASIYDFVSMWLCCQAISRHFRRLRYGMLASIRLRNNKHIHAPSKQQYLREALKTQNVPQVWKKSIIYLTPPRPPKDDVVYFEPSKKFEKIWNIDIFYIDAPPLTHAKTIKQYLNHIKLIHGDYFIHMGRCEKHPWGG